jgi:RNA-directed DNA polymerase
MKEIKQQIHEKLKKAESINDFIDAYNQIISIKNSIDGKKRIPLDVKVFTYLYRTLNNQYIGFKIPKKTGGEREISAPKKQLKQLQRNISILLDFYYQPNDFTHGFVRERSIVSNAERHTNKNYILNIDLQDFFPSINYFRIYNSLTQLPFEFSELTAKIIARIACKDGTLPQGSPMSPIISNLCCSQLDIDLSKFAKKNKLDYTRYADDITFSGYRPIFDSHFFTELGKIIRRKNNFKIKKSKTRILSINKRQEVTGIVVNDKLNVNRTYIRNLRAQIHYLHSGKAEKNAEAVISGKLEFLKMVKGKDRVYRNLYKQFKTQKNE